MRDEPLHAVAARIDSRSGTIFKVTHESNPSRDSMERFRERNTFLKPADQQLALVDRLRREAVMKLDKQLFVRDHLGAPGGMVDHLELLEFFLREFEAVPFDVLVSGDPSDGGL